MRRLHRGAGRAATAAACAYRAVNSCIQFVGTLDGKQLLTVEDLAEPDGALHPCQQAMVDCHGSQCGFCTPGFVMSLFALYQEPDTPDRNRIDDALAGNLCRCTGYGPIVAAAKAMKAGAEPTGSRGRARRDGGRAQALDDGGDGGPRGDGRRYFAPRSVDALAELLLDHPGATILAGGTDVGLWVTKQLRRLRSHHLRRRGRGAEADLGQRGLDRDRRRRRPIPRRWRPSKRTIPISPT